MMDTLSEMIEAGHALAKTCGHQDLARALAGLRARYEARELFVVLVGETSVGKTTLVNSALGESLLPATPGATTGVPVEVRFHRGPRRFECVHRSGEVEEVDRARLRELAVTPGAVHRLRVFWPVAQAAGRLAGADDLAGLVLVDAPGFNSLESDHQEILLDVIPESDAVIFMTNYRGGVTAADAKMLRLVQQFVDEPDVLKFAVNRVPSAGHERKCERMRRDLAAIVQRPLDLHNLERRSSSPARPNELRIWSDSLWSELVALANAPERRAQVEKNARGVLLSALAQMDAGLTRQIELLERRRHEGVEPIQRELYAVRETQDQARALLERAAEDITCCIGAEVDRGRAALYERACDHIADAPRLTGATKCGAWVNDHIVPVEVQRTAGSLEKLLRRQARDLDRELENLAAKLDELPSVQPSVAEVPYESTRDAGARAAAGHATAAGFGRVLDSLGGAAGREAGFVNLAKKTVSKTGRLFGKRFGRPVYDNMGRVLRKLGLNAGRATGIVVMVVIEAVAYLYHVARWKQKLLGVLQHTLDMEAVDEPIEDALMRKLPWRKKRGDRPLVWLREETVRSALEAIATTQDAVAKNLARREEVLEQTLSATGGAVDLGLAKAAERSARVRELMNQVSQEPIHVQA